MASFSFYIEDYERSPAVGEVLVGNRAFLYGEAAVTCTLLRQGVPLFGEDHLRRLERSWQSFYPRCNPAWLRAKLVKNWRKIPRLPGNHYLKVVLFASDQGRNLGRLRDDILPHVICYGGEYLGLSSPVSLHTVRRGQVMARRFGKVPYFLEELDDLQRVGGKQGCEALIIGPGGRVLASSFCNVFVVRGKSVATPRLSPELGILGGIARKHFIKTLHQHGITCTEIDLFHRDLAQAEGILLSNSLRQIVVAHQLDGRQLNCPFGIELQALYDQSCSEYFNVHG